MTLSAAEVSAGLLFAHRHLLLRVDGVHQGEYPCNDTGPTHVLLNRPADGTAVVVEVVTGSDTTWALLVSTGANPAQ